MSILRRMIVLNGIAYGSSSIHFDLEPVGKEYKSDLQSIFTSLIGVDNMDMTQLTET